MCFFSFFFFLIWRYRTTGCDKEGERVASRERARSRRHELAGVVKRRGRVRESRRGEASTDVAAGNDPRAPVFVFLVCSTLSLDFLFAFSLRLSRLWSSRPCIVARPQRRFAAILLQFLLFFSFALAFFAVYTFCAVERIGCRLSSLYFGVLECDHVVPRLRPHSSLSNSICMLSFFAIQIRFDRGSFLNVFCLYLVASQVAVPSTRRAMQIREKPFPAAVAATTVGAAAVASTDGAVAVAVATDSQPSSPSSLASSCFFPSSSSSSFTQSFSRRRGVSDRGSARILCGEPIRSERIGMGESKRGERRHLLQAISNSRGIGPKRLRRRDVRQPKNTQPTVLPSPGRKSQGAEAVDWRPSGALRHRASTRRPDLHCPRRLQAELSIEASSRRKSAGCQTTLRRLLLPVLAVKNLKYIL